METMKPQKDPSRRHRILGILPGGGRLLQIIWPFLVIVIVLLGLSAGKHEHPGGDPFLLRGREPMVQGPEAAMFSLLRYTETRALQDYYNYREGLAVTLGDQKARLELEKPNPDLAIAWQGFIEGRNHPDDIPGLIMLFRTFRHVDFMAAVIDLWTEGDRYIGELNAVAEEVHALIASGNDTPEGAARISRTPPGDRYPPHPSNRSVHPNPRRSDAQDQDAAADRQPCGGGTARAHRHPAIAPHGEVQGTGRTRTEAEPGALQPRGAG
jgi:hypothetical protein